MWIAASSFAGVASAQSVDTATISGLGMRNIGSAAMSGRIPPSPAVRSRTAR